MTEERFTVAEIDYLIERLVDACSHREQDVCWTLTPDAVAVLREYRGVVALFDAAREFLR